MKERGKFPIETGHVKEVPSWVAEFYFLTWVMITKVFSSIKLYVRLVFSTCVSSINFVFKLGGGWGVELNKYLINNYSGSRWIWQMS